MPRLRYVLSHLIPCYNFNRSNGDDSIYPLRVVPEFAKGPHVEITLFEKPGCCLCDEARALLEDLASHVAFELREVDIRDDATIFARYRYRIPVISIDGREVLEGKIEAGDLARALPR